MTIADTYAKLKQYGYDPEFYRVRNQQMSDQALRRFWRRRRKRFKITVVGSLCGDAIVQQRIEDVQNEMVQAEMAL